MSVALLRIGYFSQPHFRKSKSLKAELKLIMKRISIALINEKKHNNLSILALVNYEAFVDFVDFVDP